MPDDTLTIRKDQPSDLDVITSHNLALAIESEGRQLVQQVVRSGVARLLADPQRGWYYLACRDSQPVGQMLVTREWSDWRDGWFWWIQSVYVQPALRKQGVYRALHEHVAAEARRAGDVCGLRLYVEQENRVAQQVYQRLGLKQTSYLLFEADWCACDAQL